MPDIQTDVSDAALVIAIRANMCDFFRHLSRSNSEEHFENEKFTRWLSPLPHPWFNGILSSKPPQDEDQAFIEDTIHYFRDKGIGIFTWWMEPHVNRLGWGPILSRYGFGFSDDTPGMAIDLNTMKQSLPSIDGLEVREVKDEESLLTWAKVFIHGYSLPPELVPITFDVWLNLGFDFPMCNYIGYLNREPVSTSTLFLGGGVAGIYSVATLPKARGKGLGAALTLHPLLEARQMGYRIGVLQSSEMGFSVYQKLGFRHLCQIENFYRSLF